MERNLVFINGLVVQRNTHVFRYATFDLYSTYTFFVIAIYRRLTDFMLRTYFHFLHCRPQIADHAILQDAV